MSGYLEKFTFSEGVRKFMIDYDHNDEIMRDEQYRQAVMRKDVYPSVCAKVYLYLEDRDGVACDNESLEDIVKYLVHKCLRSQDVLALREASGEIIIAAAKEFDPKHANTVMEFLRFPDMSRSLDVEDVRKRLIGGITDIPQPAPANVEPFKI